MIAAGLTVVALFAAVSDAKSALIARIEGTELLVNRQSVSRIERDSEGNIVKLRLDGMRLTSEDFRSLGRLTSIRFLSLRGTNVTDADLRQLQALKDLEYLILTSTEVTDAAVGEITRIESLKTICLGNVAVSPEAIAKLKEHFHAQGRRLSLGYFQRKTP